jgi:hypothetical protein
VLNEVPFDNWGIRDGQPASQVDLGFKVNVYPCSGVKRERKTDGIHKFIEAIRPISICQYPIIFLVDVRSRPYGRIAVFNRKAIERSRPLASGISGKVTAVDPNCLDSLMGGISSESVVKFFMKHQAASANG